MGTNYNSDQIAKQSKIDKDAKLVEVQNKADMQRLLRFPEFKRFCWRKLSDAGIFRATFSNNAMAMAFAEGRRSSGLDLLDDVNKADPYAFAQLQSYNLAEQKSKEETENALKEKEKENQDANPK